MAIEITFLGTGTSNGIPVIGCHCDVCASKNIKDKRFRSSIYVKTENAAFVIDTGPDFRSQILNNKIEILDAVFITHAHKDHIAGLDDVKPFAKINGKDFPIYANVDVLQVIRSEFSYAFEKYRYPGIPKFKLHKVDSKSFFLCDTRITPILVFHYRLPILGYRVGKMAYITDASLIPDSSFPLLKKLDVLIINALRKEKHIAHFTLEEALQMIEKIKPQRAYLTHASHDLGLHEEISKQLPENVFLAYDGLKLHVSE